VTEACGVEFRGVYCVRDALCIYLVATIDCNVLKLSTKMSHIETTIHLNIPRRFLRDCDAKKREEYHNTNDTTSTSARE
jgi:hypothetical protein